MKVPGFALAALRRWAMRVVLEREPDFVIGQNYLHRWYLTPWRRRGWSIAKRLPNLYLHWFSRSDDDRALHDHPWASVSIIVHGEYDEIVPADERNPTGETITKRRTEGDITLRRAGSPHRIAMTEKGHAVTLFIIGPKVRSWGFWCPQGWRPWQKFVSPKNSGEVGRGCE